MTGVPRPAVDIDSAPFWSALLEHRLSVQRCDGCGSYRFPPGPICSQCLSPESTWTDLSGLGRVAGWVVSHHVTHPAFVPRIPFVVLLVELEEQPGLMTYGNLRPQSAPVSSGMPVHSVWEDVDEELTLLQWGPRPSNGAARR